MKLNYDVKRQKWNAETADIVSAHDVVFRAPVCDPAYGLPVGDGDTGCLLWLSENALNININKTDLWEDGEQSDPICCSASDENVTAVRHGALLKFDFGCPIFESAYQKSFEARLSLSDALASIDAETPFGKANVSAFSSRSSSVSVIKVDFASPDLPLTLFSAERWGSRGFWFWYSSYKNVPEKGLDGTRAEVDGDILYITQHLNATDFCVAVKIQTSARHDNRRAGDHRADCRFDADGHISATFFAAIAVGSDTEDARLKAFSLVNAAAERGRDALYNLHRAEWRSFWNKSFVCLPQNQNYIENLWYLSLYYANSEMRGKYPPHFCNGIWGFFHDFVPWSLYFHYNMQLATFPMEAANHPELLETYYDFRVRQLPLAIAYADKIMGAKGAFYADTCDRYGKNTRSVDQNCTCASQIAMSLYRRYQYGGDEDFLHDKAIPVMKAAGEFYLDRLKMGADGYYHIHETQGYEGSPLMDDSITDLAMIHSLFAALVKILPKDEAAAYSERLKKLTPYTSLPLGEDEVKDGVFVYGIGKSKKPVCDSVLSVGREPLRGGESLHDGKTLHDGEILRNGVMPYDGESLHGGKPLRKTYGDQAKDTYGFPDTEMAPVFPSGTVGIGDRGTKLFSMIQNSVYLHHHAVPAGNPDGIEPDGMCMGWCMLPIYMARLGMAEELRAQLRQTVNTWMIYPQGFGIYGGYEDAYGYSNLRWKIHNVRNSETGEMSESPAWSFRHFDFETLPIIAAAVNEMLLQSYDGVIRLFPAVMPEDDLNFRLAAVGGFIVNASLHAGDFRVYIECGRGGELAVALPDGTEKPVFTCVGEVVFKDGIYSVNTSAGETVIIESRAGLPENFCGDRDFVRNGDVKRLGDAHLGAAKQF